MARHELADSRRTQEAVTDERKPYEAPEVRDCPGYLCPSCGNTVLRVDDERQIHALPECEQWKADHPAPESEPAPETPDNTGG